MQALTRNPLADPGLLGVNAGASAAVVIALSLGLAGAASSVWFAFIGAARRVGRGVHDRHGGPRRRDARPARARRHRDHRRADGADLRHRAHRHQLLQQYNFWSVGLARRPRPRRSSTRSCRSSSSGCSSRCALARSLNALALGRRLRPGARRDIGRTRIGGAVAIVLLCGAATAGGRADVLPRPHGPARGARAVRPRPALDPGLLRRARRGAAARRRRDRPRDRAPGRAAGGRHDGRDRRARVHRARAPASGSRSCERARACAPGRVVRFGEARLAADPRAVGRRRADPRRARCSALSIYSIGTGEFPVSPGTVVSALLGDARRRLGVHRARAAAAARAVRDPRRRSRSASPARCSSRSTRNPLGSPDIVGFPQGATVGALIVITIMAGSGLAVTVGALVGGAITAFAVYLLAFKRGGTRASGSC